jgi:hypothetical protein
VRIDTFLNDMYRREGVLFMVLEFCRLDLNYEGVNENDTRKLYTTTLKYLELAGSPLGKTEMHHGKRDENDEFDDVFLYAIAFSEMMVRTNSGKCIFLRAWANYAKSWIEAFSQEERTVVKEAIGKACENLQLSPDPWKATISTAS